MRQAEFDDAVAIDYAVRKAGAVLWVCNGRLHVYPRDRVSKQLWDRCRDRLHYLIQLLTCRALNGDYP